ncbi:acyl-CoA dehydrogenase family protein [Caryophanon tenue]|uniref:Acyl-CoA dehydrogenase n=1 Tax=Caryophanon tenue TaxID=33978 RepID=A0A1C0YMF0_9BACL|nr:acyl-CoA dehydrogenase family protein [Caryophanon tenue]OCS88334.1 acyl-CoA dehydrogenase [Caryophanon tenue]
MQVTYAFETAEHQQFRKSFRKFLEAEIAPHYAKWDKEGAIPFSMWKQMGDMGYLCPQVEEVYGGLGLDYVYNVIIAEELERVGSGLMGFGLHSDIIVPYVEKFGNASQKERWLPGCVRGDIITAIAMTEPGVGSNLAGVQTTAVKDGDHYIVNGSKTFISNGLYSNIIITVVSTDKAAGHKGISLLVIEEGTEGFTRGRALEKVGQHAQDTAELFFDNCRVPVENLLGEEGQGFYYLMQNLQPERLGVAIASVIAMEDMLAHTTAYVKERHAFGQPISHFQNTQFALAEMATTIEMGRTFVEKLIQRHMNGDNIVTEVSMAKYRLSEQARDMAAQCMQLHGGYGFMEEYKIARRYRDVAVFPIYAGTNEIMKTIIAKNLKLTN